MVDMPTWQVLLLHLPTMFGSLAGVITAAAAWRAATKSISVSRRNEERLVVVHEAVNGERDRLRGEVDDLRAELAALRREGP